MKKTRRILSCLIALLLLFLQAAVPGDGAAETAGEAESESVELAYARRLEQARKKYNEETIHLFRSGIGRKIKGKLNVAMYRPEGQKYYNVCIYGSTQITDEAEMEAVLEVVMRDKNFNRKVYGPISNLKAQWIAHNIAYSMATGSDDSGKLIVAMMGEDISMIIARTTDLDLSTPEEMSVRESLLYSLIETVYQTDKSRSLPEQ